MCHAVVGVIRNFDKKDVNLPLTMEFGTAADIAERAVEVDVVEC